MGDQDPTQAAVIPSSQIIIDSSECLGSGAVGAVYKARYANETVVVKKLKLTSLSQRAREEFKQEAWTLSKLNHPRIVRFLGVILDDQYCIVLEYLRHGSLYSFYTAHEKIPFSNRMSLAVDIASGMDFLHRLNPPVLHRDVKSLNILLYVDSVDEMHAKITDFGISVVMQSTLTSTSFLSTGASAGSVESQKGSLIWMAPELFSLKSVYRPSCDVYSFGIVLSELFSWNGPFGIPIVDLRAEVLQHHLTVQKEVPEIELDEDHPNDELLALVTRCCSFEAASRPLFPEILETLVRISKVESQPVLASEMNLEERVQKGGLETAFFDVTQTSMSSRGGSAHASNAERSVATSNFDVMATSVSARAGVSGNHSGSSGSAAAHEEPPAKFSFAPANIEQTGAASIQNTFPKKSGDSGDAYPYAATEIEKHPSVRIPVNTAGVTYTSPSEWRDLPAIQTTRSLPSEPLYYKAEYPDQSKSVKADELDKAEETKRKRRKATCWFVVIVVSLIVTGVGAILASMATNKNGGDQKGPSGSSTSLSVRMTSTKSTSSDVETETITETELIPWPTFPDEPEPSSNPSPSPSPSPRTVAPPPSPSPSPAPRPEPTNPPPPRKSETWKIKTGNQCLSESLSFVDCNSGSAGRFEDPNGKIMRINNVN
ncbi:Leucine-rich repeat serine/threonine-protein kinase 2 [Phlyctochytrium planicorne]|nr:Leucine-rich repeat serine/threonine-protein kinase 2 [Phlyctochytrium planicorne]